MAVTFDVVKLSPDQMRGTLPPWVIPSLDKSDTYSFAALDNGQLVGVAIFSCSPDRPMAMLFRYIYLIDSYKHKGIAKQLMTFSEQKLKENGAKTIFCRLMGDVKTLRENYKFMVKNKYMPLTMNGHFVMYYLEELVKTNFSKRLGDMTPIVSKVKYFNGTDKITVRKFIEKAKASGYNYDIEKMDLLFASLYIPNGEAEGIMNLEEVSENILMLNGTYMSPQCDKFALPAMIAKSLMIAIKVMPDKTALFYQLFDEQSYNGLKTLFGTAEVDYILQEYFKSL